MTIYSDASHVHGVTLAPGTSSWAPLSGAVAGAGRCAEGRIQGDTALAELHCEIAELREELAAAAGLREEIAELREGLEAVRRTLGGQGA